MGSSRDDRYLQERDDGGYRFVRRVPKEIQAQVGRTIFRQTLKTSDLAVARARRDLIETAQDEFWSALAAGRGDNARQEYSAACARALSLNLVPMTAGEIAAQTPEEILERVEHLATASASTLDENAVLGLIRPPKTSLDEAFRVFCDEIRAPELQTKSPNQRRHWRKIKLRAIKNFKAVVGDIPLEDITRSNALELHKLWLDRIVAGTHSHDAGNRDLGNMRILYREYFAHVGDIDRPNPFRDLSFKGGKKTPRPPFTVEWIQTKILAPGALDGLNEDARGVVYGMIDSGCRPSEICNMPSECIVLDAAVPHVRIRDRVDREIKTETSNRDVPLVGVSLAAFQQWPAGFSGRYGDREDALSNLLNKFFKNNGLFPTPRHSVYSIRHSFEKRMLEGGLGDELRRRLMGHSLERPDYGGGGSLEYRRNELQKIALDVPEGLFGG